MKILVPLDGSELSQAVLPWLKLLADPAEDKVEILRSFLPVEQLHLFTGLPITIVEMVNNNDLVREVEKYLEDQSAKFPNLATTTKWVADHPVTAILDRSEDKGLVIMASHGQSGLNRWIMGSVTTQIVRASNTPVLVINSHTVEFEPTPGVKKILVPLDQSPRAEQALEMAAKLAKRVGAKLLLYQGVFWRWRTSQGEQSLINSARLYLEKLAESITDVETEVCAHPSVDGPRIVEQSQVHDADLIVMTSHGRSGLSRWVLGSVTENVVQRAECPVLVVYNRPL